MIKAPNEHGKLNIKDLEEFEKDNAIQLPEDYRQFLIKYNGGTPTHAHLKEPKSQVSLFFGIVDEPDWFSLFDAIIDLEGRIPEFYMPIADDENGNVFIMGFGDTNKGKVAFWNHELESGEEDGGFEYFSNVTPIADSFDAFVKMLGGA